VLFRLNPSNVPLQVVSLDQLGRPKTDVASATVRVYRVLDAGTEDELLATTPLAQVGTTNIWRYTWLPASLGEGVYHALYSLVDTNGYTTKQQESFSVRDIAKEETLEGAVTTLNAVAANVLLILKVETGRWRIVDNQMIFYDTNGTTPLYTFDLKDINGMPSNVNIFERDPV
jgi:hypothetical protein